MVEAVAAAAAAKKARAGAVPFGRVVDAYRQHLLDEGKRYDKAGSLIANIEAFIGRDRDTVNVDFDVYKELLSEVGLMTAETRRHYASCLLAMLNFAKAERIIKSHELDAVRLPTVRKNDSPVTWTQKEIDVLLGPALTQYEREQGRWNDHVGKVAGSGSFRAPSHVPLRGFMLIGYYTLMRPRNNRALTWEEVTIDPETRTGFFKLDQHKNVNKGIKASGPLSRKVIDYLLAIRPANATGLIHRNPATGEAYVDIRKQWRRLIAIASRMLGYELKDQKADFFTFRHTGASHMAKHALNGSGLIHVVNMMGDAKVETVRRHYFNFELTDMAEIVDRWSGPAPPDDAEPSDGQPSVH